MPFPKRKERKFQPWHRPRKQYVRRAQWCREISNLARDLKRTKGELSEIRYLTLPGNDLLDIRQIAETICAPQQIELRYLGFNSAAIPTAEDQPELDGAQFSINRMDWIQRQSEVFAGDFRRVADTRSVPYQRMKRDAPFHAINIDLCGGFAGREKDQGVPNYFTALRAILHNQARFDEPFLLFITTRMDDDNVAEEVKETLLRLAQEIHDTCLGYSAAFADAWGVQEGDAPVLVPQVVDTSEAFMLGLTQWIISNAISFELKASVRSFMTYRTGLGVGEDDIVSLAIRLKREVVLPPDPHELGQPFNASPSQAERQCEQSAIVPERVSKRTRVDALLRTQAEEFERCIGESSALLGSAGYDPVEYRTWAIQQEGLDATS